MPASYPEPSCPNHPVCPGCPGLGVPYAQQREAKRERVTRAFQGYPELAELAVDAVVAAAPIFGYRTRAKLVAQAGVGLGLYGRGAHDLVDLPGCGVLLPEVEALVVQLRAWVRGGLPIEALDVASASGARLITFVVSPEHETAGRSWLASRLGELPEDVHVALSRRADGPQLLGTGHVIMRGHSDVRAVSREGGPYHYLTHGGFVQAHGGIARAIYARTRDAIRAIPGVQKPRVLELYAGAGALALALAADGCDVTAVEAFAPAVARLARAAHEQRLTVAALSGDAGQLARELAARGERYDAVLVNPPRRGLDPTVRAAIMALAPRSLIYLSCSPETLARDLAHFARGGLAARAVTPFDMIPLTSHVETFAILGQSTPPPLPFERRGRHLVAERAPFVDGAQFSQALQRVCSDALVYAPPTGMSGLALAGQSAPLAVSATVLARGITHKRGKLGAARYQCEARVGGHSLLRIDAAPDALAAVFAALAKLGHPVVGDRRDAKTARHFVMRHGLDRPFAHVGGVTLEDGSQITRPLAPDLVAVLVSLRGELPSD